MADNHVELDSPIGVVIITSQESKKRDTLLSMVEIQDLDADEVEVFKIARSFQKLMLQNADITSVLYSELENAKYYPWIYPINQFLSVDNVTLKDLRRIYISLRDNRVYDSYITSTYRIREYYKSIK